MKTETAAALDRVNRRFYSRHGGEFARTRTKPWPGWDRLATILGDAPSILDAGCGNGRFGRFLADRLTGPIHYLGVDTSLELLELAERWTATEVDSSPDHDLLFAEADLLAAELPADVVAREFDLVTAFGVMHHVAGEDRRRRLLRRLAARVAPGGLLAVSFWQFGARSRFARRSVPPEQWVERTGEAMDATDLEPGDHLLVWGELPGSRTSVRYCHYADPTEVERLTTDLGLEALETYFADGAAGNLNLYRVLRRSPAGRRPAPAGSRRGAESPRPGR